MPYKPKPLSQRHKKTDDRPSAHQRGYTARWRRARRIYLRDNPLCAICKSNGTITQATVIDHIIPHRRNYDAFWDTNNWQPLCKACHDRKTAQGQ